MNEVKCFMLKRRSHGIRVCQSCKLTFEEKKLAFA